jgi:hypothetical protein
MLTTAWPPAASANGKNQPVHGLFGGTPSIIASHQTAPVLHRQASHDEIVGYAATAVSG